jgi:Na+/H+-dicarboxylate symporters
MNKYELCTQLENYEAIRKHIVGILEKNHIDKRSQNETLLVFEALYNDMIERGIPGNTQVTVWKAGHFGSVNIRFQFRGPFYSPLSDDADDLNADQRIMHVFWDRVEHRYHDGTNFLTLVTKRSVLMALRNIGIAMALGIAAFIVIMSFFESPEQQESIRTWVFQGEMLFAKAMLSIGAPVTFFSLLRNLTNMYILREGDSMMRSIQGKALLSSAVAVLLAVCAAIIASIPMALIYYGGTASISGILPGALDVDVDLSLIELFQSIVSSSIFETFSAISPFPIIIGVVLTAYALCASGNYFESIKKVVDGAYVLFSKMLTALMFTLPFFFFLAILEGMLRQGPGAVIYSVSMAVFVPVTMILLALFYVVRLAVRGISPFPFIKKLGPLLKENLTINSTIEAVPFNLRYCVSKYGFDRKMSERVLPMLAQINLDGNCFIITLIALMLMFTTGTGISWLDVAIVGLTVFFLSLGAPNQPGSILIGLLVIFSYMNALDFVALAIFSEAILGPLLSVANAAGDIVTIAITEKQQKASGRA